MPFRFPITPQRREPTLRSRHTSVARHLIACSLVALSGCQWFDMVLPAEKVGQLDLVATASTSELSLQTFQETGLLVGLDNYVTFTVTTSSSDGERLDGRVVRVTSSDESVFTVEDGAEFGATGRSYAIVAMDYGTATVRIESEGKREDVPVTVAPPVASVVVSPTSATLAVGGSQQFTATLRDASGTVLTGRRLKWWMTTQQATGWTFDTSKAVVRTDGVLVAKAPVSGRVYAIVEERQANERFASVPVTVLEPVAGVTVSAPSSSVGVGNTLQFTSVLRDAAGNALTGRTVSWQSSNPGVLSIGSTTGLATGVAVGSATVTATSEGRSGTLSVSVINIPVASVTLSPTSASISIGGTQQLTATTRDASGNTLTGRTVTWTTSNAGVAQVNASGLVTAVATGTAIVTATSEGRAATATISVSAPVSTVTVTSSSGSLSAGGTMQFTATLRDAAGNVLTGRTVTWSSSNGAVASVSTTGLVTALASGSATITATSEGRSGSKGLTVTVPTATANQTLTPGIWYQVPSVSQGSSLTFFAQRSTTAAFSVQITGGTGDADLFVYAPSASNYSCWLDKAGNEETCTVGGSTGQWRLVVSAYTSFSGVFIRVQ